MAFLDQMYPVDPVSDNDVVARSEFINRGMFSGSGMGYTVANVLSRRIARSPELAAKALNIPVEAAAASNTGKLQAELMAPYFSQNIKASTESAVMSSTNRDVRKLRESRRSMMKFLTGNDMEENMFTGDVQVDSRRVGDSARYYYT